MARRATKETAVRDSAQLNVGKLNRRAWEAHTPCGSSTEEQRSQAVFCATTLRAAGLLAVGGVGSVVTARCGDAPPLPPCPHPKSQAAAPLEVINQALKVEDRAGFGARGVFHAVAARRHHFLADELREFFRAEFAQTFEPRDFWLPAGATIPARLAPRASSAECPRSFPPGAGGSR
jgi:hypothetical protein